VPFNYGYDNKVLTQNAVIDIATGEHFLSPACPLEPR